MSDAIKVAAKTHEASLFEYEGVHFADTNVKKETLDGLPKWPARKDDVFVVTYPKAGLYDCAISRILSACVCEGVGCVCV